MASATVQRPEFQAWVTGLVSSDVHGAIKGRSVGDAVARLQECEDEAYLISLDLMKGFEYLRPAISVGLMAHLGLPDLWVKHFRHAWSSQKRFLHFGRFVDERPVEVGFCTPQGDAMAPVALILAMQHGANAFAELGLRRPALQALFVDDREIIVHHPEDVRLILDHWQTWSQRLGPRKNASKLRVACRHAAHQVRLRGIVPLARCVASCRS